LREIDRQFGGCCKWFGLWCLVDFLWDWGLTGIFRVILASVAREAKYRDSSLRSE
jgi:hypothetical protein